MPSKSTFTVQFDEDESDVWFVSSIELPDLFIAANSLPDAIQALGRVIGHNPLKS